ncbi:MAG: tetratricopeptide repeat protein [bacterium]|nr:tetratricopeptide repeat protein [bacterium]
MNKTSILIMGGIAVIFIAGIVQFFPSRSIVSPTLPVVTSTSNQSDNATTTGVAATTTVARAPGNPATHPLSLTDGDNIVSWNFKGAYTNNPELTAKAMAEINRLSSLLATATSSAMILSVSIANQYELLGDGKKQYEYLGRAIQASPENGLPWHNLGVLMERLGALKTARIAYEKSTLVQPEFKFYHYAYIEFLTSRTKNDVASIEEAFAFAEKNIGTTSYLAELRTAWQTP